MTIRLRLRPAVSTIVLLATISTCSGLAGAQTVPDDRAALEGLKEVKVAFDITTGNARALLGALAVIEETRQSLIKQGVTPHIVLAFRGPATLLVQSDQTRIKPEDRENAAQIAAKLKALRGAPGIEGMEQCSIAARQLAVKKENVLPEVTVVGNGWISLMAYQAKGYAYIAP